ncbi:MAG: phage integrase SAM-like domain-containing protein [[Clostridium] fimetarium]|nr:phage integrase SAM-like domain-containing protein [Alistipes timonensis]MCM1404798.1 phage integrase SAM-like domain-containing protein [[Clostridium] fimetarium]
MDESVELQSVTAAEDISPANPAPEEITAGAGNECICGTRQKVYFGPNTFGMALAGLFEELSRGFANENTRRDAEKFVAAFKAFAARGICRIDAELVTEFRIYLADRGHTASYIAKRMQNFRSLYRRLAREGRVEEAPAGSFDIVGSDHPAGNREARKCAADGGEVAASLGRLARMTINDAGLAASRDNLIAAVLSAGRVDSEGLEAAAPILLRSCGLSADRAFSAELAVELWIRAARECGVPAREIAAVCGEVPEGFGEGQLAGNDTSEIDCDAVLRRVSSAVLGDEPAWYALRLRPGSDSAAVRGLLASDARLSGVKPYAPVEQLMVRRGKRLKSTVVARIRNVMFLEATPALIPVAAVAISSAATVYRQSRQADAPFARIPADEMRNFRILLDGAADDDLELIDGTECAELPAGTDVEVTDGPFAGYRGRVSSSGTRRHLTVSLTSDFGLRVTATIPDLFLRPITQQ